jgi:hypothetical protein
MRFYNRTAASTLALAALWALPAAAKEEKVSLDKVPAVVVKAEKAKWPKAEIVGIEREEENGKTIFEFGLKDGTRKLDVSFSSDGALVAVEETIAAGDVPATVRGALEKKHPQPTVVLVERVTEGEGKSAKIFYEYKIKTNQGGLELKFDLAGKLVSEEQKKAEDLNE